MVGFGASSGNRFLLAPGKRGASVFLRVYLLQLLQTPGAVQTEMAQHDLSYPCVLCIPFMSRMIQVISCVGAPESAPLDPSGPRRIDGDGSVALVEAAAAAGVIHALA